MALTRTDSTKVGRRIVVSFLLFALVPLVVFALQARARVASELATAARERLQADLKSAGVTLFERLRVAADDLTAHRGTDRSESLLLGPIRDAKGLVAIDADLEAALDRHDAVLHLERKEAGPEFWLLSRREDGRVAAARLADDVVFAPEGIARPPATVSIHDLDGQLLNAMGPLVPGPEILRGAGLGESARADYRWSEEGAGRLGGYWEVFMEPRLGRNLVVSIQVPESVTMAPLAAYSRDLLRTIVLTILTVLFLAMLRIKKMLRPVTALVEATARIGRQEKGVRITGAGDDEFGALAEAINEMATTLERRTEVMAAVNQFGIDLASELDSRVLVRRLMRGSSSMFRVDGVAVHLLDPDDRMVLDQLRIRSLGVDIDRDHDAAPALGFPAAELELMVETIDDIESSDSPVARQLRNMIGDRSYVLRDAVVIPMLDHEGLAIGLLTIFNAESSSGEPVPIDDETAGLAASLAGQASVGIGNARLRGEFKALFDAMIDVLAVAVDEKSPYTGGHCRRVPKIAMMLFDEVNRSSQGPFAEVEFDEAKTYEMQVASLLHDCGKVVTPVHIIDKATKLETIWDRIDLVDQRFELVVHQRAADEFRRIAEAAGADVAAAEETIAGMIAKLREDREFIRKANIGGEFMSDEHIERIERISKDWRFTELEYGEQDFLNPEEKMNLKVRKGTLNEAERQIINYHMDATIMMLEQLPFPRRLRDVPAIAGSHHERMDGKGFPKKLKGDEILLQGRMLAIADVFEALTATDRPYKKGMPLSQALKIMAFMGRDGHLDPDLLRVFMETGIWKRYADEVLAEEQRDEVDVAAMIAIYQPAAAV